MSDKLIFKYFSGQSTKKETQEVREWMDNSEERKKRFSRLKNAWVLSGLDNEIDPEIKEREIKRILRRIRGIARTGNKNNRQFRWLKYAAAVTLIVSLSASVGYFVSKWHMDQQSGYTEVIVTKGERSKIVLPDGSIVQLNGDSHMKFDPLFYSKQRKVIFEGEAFFQVTHDASHPFVVETPNFNVKVLGTKFNVSSYPNDSIQTTYLESGKVEISLGEKSDIFLKPSEAFEYDNTTGTFRKLKINDTRFTDWTKGILTIKGETIGEFSKILERRFDIHVIFGDNEVKNHVYTGSIKDEDLASVLEAIKFASSIDYQRQGRTVTLYSK